MLDKITRRLNTITDRIRAMVLFLALARKVNLDNPLAMARGLEPLIASVEHLLNRHDQIEASMASTETMLWSDARSPEGDDYNDLAAEVNALVAPLCALYANSPVR
ncbi:hypothetical protein [Magnetospirillum molischianum]|uniref:Uncharacterized protein n=1 Tax=Magnetospirillum molischianum DSM 120 TaxID=1150626 RepID=H8FXY2_MAGML|nr:hypothetical protein [Magnetospirillum molischianum]CCG43220.1 hypothetical protein PHAMO_80011 [Magnetospirillum molischianum DSM 120]